MRRLAITLAVFAAACFASSAVMAAGPHGHGGHHGTVHHGQQGYHGPGSFVHVPGHGFPGSHHKPHYNPHFYPHHNPHYYPHYKPHYYPHYKPHHYPNYGYSTWHHGCNSGGGVYYGGNGFGFSIQF